MPSTNLPPYHKTDKTTQTPKNSLRGEAIPFLRKTAFMVLRYLWVEVLNFSFTLDSAVKALIIFKPPNDSSKKDRKSPDSFCASNDLAFNVLPTLAMIKPVMGRKMNTKSVSCQLMASIEKTTKKMVRGSLAKVSRELIIALSISLMSEVIRDKRSPFRFSEL